MEQENLQPTPEQVHEQPSEAGNTSAEVSESTQQKAATSSNEEHIRALRSSKEKLEQQNRELLNRLKQIEEKQQSQAKAAPEQKYDPDDLVERRYVDERLKNIEQQVTQTSTEYRLKNQYPDFDKVVNDATIAQLKEKNPVLADAIGQVPDFYNKAAAAYEAIKNLGLYNEDNYAKERAQAQDNSQKPRPLTSISPQKADSPIAQANAFAEGLTDDYKKQLGS